MRTAVPNPFAVFAGISVWFLFCFPSVAQIATSDGHNLSVPAGELVLPEVTMNELLPLYIAEKIERRGLAQDLDCQVLFNHMVEDLDPAYKNQKKSIVKRPPDTSDPKVASSYLAHLSYSSVVNSYVSGAGLPDDFVPGPLLSAVREGLPDAGEFQLKLREAYSDCAPRFLTAVEGHKVDRMTGAN